MTNELVMLVVSLIVGGLLGILFFLGLQVTIYRALLSKRPGLWFLLSFLVRTSILIMGFWGISNGEIYRLICCILGFTIMRFMYLHFFRKIPN